MWQGVTKKAAICGLLLFLFFLVTVVFSPISKYYGVFDSQRILQLIFILIFLLFFSEDQSHKIFGGYALVLFFVSGIISSILAARPPWAFLEVSVFLGLFLFSFFVAKLGPNGIEFFEKCIAVFSLLFALKVTVGLLVVSSNGGGVSVLSSAFSNHRHFVEFLVGVFVFSAFYFSSLHRGLALSLFLLVICWAVIFLGGGRASFLALLSSILLFVFYNKKNRKKIIVLSALSFFIGLFVYVGVSGISTEDGEPLVLARWGASGRLDLWFHGLDLWRSSPIFGLGPMHYAYYSSGLLAHPHNLPIQIISEWGGVGFISISYFILFALFVIQSRIKLANPSTIRALCCFYGLLISSLFGGVLIVPATQLFFFTVLGVMLADLMREDTKTFEGLRLVSLLAAFVIFSSVILIWEERGALEARGAAVEAPRFWQNGGIILDPPEEIR